MSEPSTFHIRDVDSYAHFVADTSFADSADGWKLEMADYLNEGVLEALAQHGGIEVSLLFLPGNTLPEDISVETRFAVADELGDSLWFTVNCLNKVKSRIPEACTQALASFGIPVEDDPNTFLMIQRLAVDNADKIRYINKAGLMEGHRDVASTPEPYVTPLPQNPYLHFTRTNRGLTRALEEGTRDIAPYASGADFEQIGSVALTAGRQALSTEPTFALLTLRLSSCGNQIKNPPKGGILIWYTRQDSNLRPLAPQANALSS